jgi:hypothetical protein
LLLPVSVFAGYNQPALGALQTQKVGEPGVSASVFVGVYLRRVQVGQRLLDKDHEGRWQEELGVAV